jgi:Uma2 family endonuclease
MGLPLPKMDLPAYLAWEDGQSERHEFVRGDVFAMVGARRVHGRVTANFTAVLSRVLTGSLCQVFAESMKVQVAEDTVLYPDVFVTCDPQDLATEVIFRAPILVIEVLSPGTQGYDRSLKFALYRQVTSLQEYALVDPDSRRIEVFRKGPDGLFVLHDMSERETLEFASIGAALPLSEIFAGLKAE